MEQRLPKPLAAIDARLLLSIAAFALFCASLYLLEQYLSTLSLHYMGLVALFCITTGFIFLNETSIRLLPSHGVFGVFLSITGWYLLWGAYSSDPIAITSSTIPGVLMNICIAEKTINNDELKAYVESKLF